MVIIGQKYCSLYNSEWFVCKLAYLYTPWKKLHEVSFWEVIRRLYQTLMNLGAIVWVTTIKKVIMRK